mmetsp:Transcript_15409/g.37855  ORF Transcript_15409/g.37855 Transcript_15409/m.37855 type:complete len:225 (-) Transcript_15409:1314-1988(-)
MNLLFLLKIVRRFIDFVTISSRKSICSILIQLALSFVPILPDFLSVSSQSIFGIAILISRAVKFFKRSSSDVFFLIKCIPVRPPCSFCLVCCSEHPLFWLLLRCATDRFYLFFVCLSGLFFFHNSKFAPLFRSRQPQERILLLLPFYQLPSLVFFTFFFFFLSLNIFAEIIRLGKHFDCLLLFLSLKPCSCWPSLNFILISYDVDALIGLHFCFANHLFLVLHL